MIKTRLMEAARNLVYNREALLMLLYVVVIAGGLFSMAGNEAWPVFSLTTNKKAILIDAGHGGWDPGKTSDGGVSEKDINLEIAEKLQAYLELSGSYVVTTRADDGSLGDSKSIDLRSRTELADEWDVDVLISIHQNSYPDGGVRGAQTFYYGKSEESKRLAELVQEEIRRMVDTDNRRLAMPNMDYYILKNTDIPAIIVECGFLSNSAEAQKLSDDEYQQKIAWAIFSGVARYFNGESAGRAK